MNIITGNQITSKNSFIKIKDNVADNKKNISLKTKNISNSICNQRYTYKPIFGRLATVQLIDNQVQKSVNADNVQIKDNASVDIINANTVFVSSPKEIEKAKALKTTLINEATINELDSQTLKMSDNSYVHKANSENISLKDNATIDYLFSDQDININGKDNSKIGEIKTIGENVIINGQIQIKDKIKFIGNKGLVTFIKNDDNIKTDITKNKIYNGDLKIIDNSLLAPLNNLEDNLQLSKQERDKNIEYSSFLQNHVQPRERDTIFQGKLVNNFVNNNLEFLVSNKELKITPHFVSHQKIGDKNLADFWLESLGKVPKQMNSNEKVKAINDFTKDEKKFLLAKSIAEYEKNIFDKDFNKARHKDLADYENELDETSNEITKPIIDINNIKNKSINGKTIVDAMLNGIEGENSSKEYNGKYKVRKLEKLLQTPENSQKAVKKTLDLISEQNSSIKATRDAYDDLLNENDDFTIAQKKMLKAYKDSKIFHSIVTNNIEDKTDINEIASNTISVTERLLEEQKHVKEKTNDTIFEPLMYIHENDDAALDANIQAKIDFVYSVLAEKMQNEESIVTKQTEENIELYKEALTTNPSKVSESWQKLVIEAKNYYNSKYIEDFTSNNIDLLNSINTNIQGGVEEVIDDAIKDRKFSIAQKEFISRYKDDKNIQTMLSDRNISDKQSAVDDLLYLEASNKQIMKLNFQNFEQNISEDTVIQNQELTNSYLEAMDIDYEDKSTKEKAEILASTPKEELKIASKKIYLEWKEKELKPYISINAVQKIQEYDPILQNQDKIVDNQQLIAEKMGNYAGLIIGNQVEQISQLNKMNEQLTVLAQNTADIKKNTDNIEKNTKAMIRMQLVELERNKYFKEVVPEITKLLPNEDKIDIGDFLKKVDIVAKKEKNAKMRKKILIAGLVVAGTIVAGAAVYYAGPAIVSHLASGLPQVGGSMTQMVNTVAQQSNIARQTGNSALLRIPNKVSFGLSHTASKYKDWLKSQDSQQLRDLADKITDSVSFETIRSWIRQAGGNPPNF